MKRVEVAEGCEIRGFVVRIYPAKEQEEMLYSLMDQARHAWNFLVSRQDDAIAANAAYAQKLGLVGSAPVKVDYTGMTPEEAQSAKLQHLEKWREYNSSVVVATKGRTECKVPWKCYALAKEMGYNYDYQLLQSVAGKTKGACTAHFYQWVAKHFDSYGKGQRRKRRKRRDEDMPLGISSGKNPLTLGNFGKRRGKDFYNCEVRLGSKLKFPGRLPGREPEGRILEGVSIKHLPDGWYASVKVEIPKRILPPAIEGSCASLDLGLTNLAAVTYGGVDRLPCIIRNPRDNAFDERLAGRQALKLPTGRMQQRAARHTRHLMHNLVVKLSDIETVLIEDLPKDIGQRGSRSKSTMRSLSTLLKDRLGDRVREVDPSFTSQDCSQCGHRSKESWAYTSKGQGKCEACGYVAHRDLNAARNIMRRGLKSLTI